MSIDVLVVLQKTKMPSIKKWQEAIFSAKYDFEFSKKFDVKKQEGTVRCKVENNECGFEYSVGTVADYNFSTEELNLIEKRNLVVSFGARSNNWDNIAAIVSSTVLASLTDGLFFDSLGNVYTSERALKYCKKEIGATKKKIKPKKTKSIHIINSKEVLESLKSNPSTVWQYVDRAFNSLKGKKIFWYVYSGFDFRLQFSQDSWIVSPIWEISKDNKLIFSNDMVSDDIEQNNGTLQGIVEKYLNKKTISKVEFDSDKSICFVINNIKIIFPCKKRRGGFDVWTLVYRGIRFEINPFSSNGKELNYILYPPIENPDLPKTI